MFGSPSASTPFAKFRTAGLSTTSLSFGQQSANKRKRDQISNAAPAEPINAHTKVRGALNLSSIPGDVLEGSTSRLLSGGQLLIVPNEGFAAYYKHNIFQPSEYAVVDKKNEDDYRGVVDGGVGPSDTTDLVACTTNGRLTIVNVSPVGAQVHMHHKLQLREEEERITLACHAGNVALLGSSSEELYLVRRYGRTLNADRLQRNRSLFANLFTSGARLIGISSAPSDGKVVKLLPVPMSFFLLALGSSSLSLWSDWTNPGSEQLVWESSIKDVLVHDLSGLNLFGGASVLTMIDACLMPVAAGDQKGTLLVLSSCENRTNSTSGALWLHTLEVQFAAGATGASIGIVHRLLLAEHADTQSTGAAPRIHHLSPSWKIFATWSAEGHSHGQVHEQDHRESAASEVRTVHGAQIDVLNQSLLNATVSREGGSQRQLLLDSLRCTSAVNSCVDVTTVLDAAFVKGHDGVTIITNDGAISVFCPPLPKRNLTEFPLTTTKLRDRQQLGSTNSLGAVLVADGVNLLHSAALGELAVEEVGKAVRDTFDTLSPADIAAAVQATSVKLMNRSPTGEYWGSVGAVGTGRGNPNRGPGSLSAGARALTQYQMVHRLVETKLNAHKKLIEIVNESDFANLGGIHHSLLKDHQTLLLCAGLSGAVEEAQLRYSSSSGPEDHAVSTSTQRVALEALVIVAQGIERAVRVGRGLSLEEIDSQGLSVVDMFYAEAWLVFDGISSIVQALRDNQASLAQKNFQLETTFTVSSIVLSALQLAMAGEGADTSAVAANCHHKVRDVVVSLIGLLRDASDAKNSVTSMESRVAGNRARSNQLSGVAVDRESKRLVELCSVALQSYAMEAVSSEDGTVESMLKDWRDKYHYVKGICSALLLSTGNHQAGFALFSEHLYCIGLMECTQRDPQTLQARLEDVVRRMGAQVGTDTVPLATGCFLWLEAHNRLADILALGTTNPALLEEFLKTRSHLAWMQHLRSGHFRQATVAAVEHASTVPIVGKAATLLSIAKLSAKLAGDAPDPAQSNQSSAKRLFLPVPSSSSSPHKAGYKTATSEAELNSAVQNLNADLAVIRAQEVVLETLPNLQADKNVRTNVSDLVKLVARALRHYGASATLAVVDEQHHLHAPDASALPRLFGMGLGLLSMQMDLLDTLLVATTAAAADNTDGGGESGTALRTPLSLMEQQHAQQSQQVRLAQLRKQEESFAALLVDLWGSLIAANLATWLELSCYPTLGAQEEQAFRTDCWLFAAVASALGEASSGNLRGELIPTAQGNEGESLLQMALTSSQITSKRLGADGEVENTPGGNVNQRVVHIIKVCVNMALHEGALMQ